MYSIFSVSRHDIHDYLRCPKIVALKTYKNLTKPKPVPKKPVARNIRYEIGTIGEVLTQKAFSDDKDSEIFSDFEGGLEAEIDEGKFEDAEHDITAEEQISGVAMDAILEKPEIRPIKLDLEKRGIQLDTEMGNVLKNTIIGLAKIKKYLSDEYGEIKIIGHGESRSGILPNKIKPDFIGISDKKKPVIIEVKNSATTNMKADNFQASFYNTIAKKCGVIVLEERKEEDHQTIIPRVINDTVSETILVYPRQGKFTRIIDTLNLDKPLIRDVWLAKQLGLKGKSPKTDCDSSCPHHRYGELPEDNLEPAIPLPLIYSKGLVEQNTDLDARYLRHYLWKIGFRHVIQDGLWDIQWAEYIAKSRTSNEFQIKKDLDLVLKKKEKFLDEITTKTGFSRQEIDKIINIEPGSYRNEMQTLEKDMKNELAPWEKLVGQKNFKKLKIAAKGQSTKLYPIPKNSKNFIKKSWQEWA